MKEYLSQKKIAFTEYNVGENGEAAMEMLKKTSQMGVPVTVIDDKDFVIGYDPSRLDELLKPDS